MAITASNVHGPAICIRLQNGLGRQRPRSSAKGFKGFETPKSLVAVGLCWAVTVRPPDDYAPEQPSGEDAVPYPYPGLDEGPRFLRRQVPRERRRGQGLGRADHIAFFAWRSALAFLRSGG